MKTIGELLSRERQAKNISIEELSKKTKIRAEYLKFIENDQFEKLPSATFVKGFIRNYASAVGISPKRAAAVFRRDFDQNQKGQVVPRGFTNPIKPSSGLWNPKTTTATLIIICILAISGYTLRQIIAYSSAPTLVVESPVDKEVTTNNVEVRGVTTTDATVEVNNQPISTDINGRFRTNVNLDSGEHTLVVEAISREGKTRTVTRSITVEER